MHNKKKTNKVQTWQYIPKIKLTHERRINQYMNLQSFIRSIETQEYMRKHNRGGVLTKKMHSNQMKLDLQAWTDAIFFDQRGRPASHNCV